MIGTVLPVPGGASTDGTEHTGFVYIAAGVEGTALAITGVASICHRKLLLNV